MATELGTEWRCLTCRHWNSKESARYDPPLGKCEAATELWEATDWERDANGEVTDFVRRVLREEHKQGAAFCQDGSDYKADLFTTDNFGCVRWGSKS